MRDSITVTLKTLSNLFIGGMPVPFEIGGIDQRTATDPEGLPCIPGSALKGALRAIVHEDRSEMGEQIRQRYKIYLRDEKEANWPRLQKLVQEEGALERIQERYLKAEEQASPEYLFGIEGFNNTPKLLFSDLVLCREFRDAKKCFSLDMKNAITIGKNAPAANPRTYQTARPGLVFEGKIQLYQTELLGKEAAVLLTEYVRYNLLKFNEGFYRLGNSKSRGYGKVEILSTGKDGEQAV